MTIEIDENTVALWYTELGILDNGTANFLAQLKKTDEGHLLTYRLRYEGNDPHPWTGNDKKSWYQAKIRGKDTGEVLQEMRNFVRMVKGAAPDNTSPVNEVLMVEGDVQDFLKHLASYEWASVRKIPIGQDNQ